MQRGRSNSGKLPLTCTGAVSPTSVATAEKLQDASLDLVLLLILSSLARAALFGVQIFSAWSHPPGKLYSPFTLI